MASRTLVVLGDSILDNAPYTRPEPDTTAHLQGAMLIVRAIAGIVAADGARASRIFGSFNRTGPS